MDISYDPERRILWVTARGVWPDEPGHKAAASQIATLDLPDNAGALIDLRRVDSDTAPRFTQIALRSDRATSRLPRRRAYLVNEGVQFGVARMIQATSPEGVEIEVFTTEDDAIRWLTGMW
jgi:hypothetical protein